VLALALVLFTSVSAMISEGNITENPTKEQTIQEPLVTPTITIEPIIDISVGIIDFPTIEYDKLVLKYHNLKSASDIVVTDADTGDLLDIAVTNNIININSKAPLRIVAGDITWIIRSYWRR